MIFQKILTKFFCRKFYPTNRLDWYKNKGYQGNNNQEIFIDFISKQRAATGKFYDCFLDLAVERFMVQSGQDYLDYVKLTPNLANDNKPGVGLVFIMFQGRGEYYESRFRDMALLAKATGASVVGFNPKGFHSSTGRTKVLRDIVADGIAVTNKLIADGFNPKQIIMLGNSLGGAVQEMVCQELRKQGVEGFRQINSNSFKSLGSVLACRMGALSLESIISKVLLYAGWEIEVGQSFYTTGPHRCYMRRDKDQTILPGAEFHDLVDCNKDLKNSPQNYREVHKWLCLHSQLESFHNSDKDPHNQSLSKFKVKKLDGDTSTPEISVFDFINKYLEASSQH